MRPFVLALGLLASVHAQADTLADLFHKAWLRLPQAQSQAARETELRATAAAASAWFPAPPVVGLAHRSDRLDRNDGAREVEIDIAVPLWLPGEQGARQQLASVESDRFASEQAALRLQLAGELREAIWQVRLAENANVLAERRLQAVRQTEEDVARRVQAGDLARADLLLAQSETSSALGEAAAASRELAAVKAVYRRLVGSDALPELMPESAADPGTLDAHPLLAARRARLEVARAKARLAAQTRRDNPELSVGARRERGDFSERYSNSVGIAFKFPLGSESRNAPRIAAAQAELIEAETEFQRQRFDIEQDIQQARANVDTAMQRQRIAESRLAFSKENLQLIKKAFSLGEKSLFEFQRAQAVLDEAALAASQSKIEVNRAYARLNQAIGALP